MFILYPEATTITDNDLGGVKFTDLVDEEIPENLENWHWLVGLEEIFVVFFEFIEVLLEGMESEWKNI